MLARSRKFFDLIAWMFYKSCVFFSFSYRGHPAVTCGHCSRIYSTRTNLEEHIKSRHAGQPPPPEIQVNYVQQDSRFQCKTCPKMYTNITDLNKHSRVCHASNNSHSALNCMNKMLFPSFNFCLNLKLMYLYFIIAKLRNALDPSSDLSSVDSDYENKDYRSAEAKLAKNPQLTILKQALIKGESIKKEYDERQKLLSKAKRQSKGAYPYLPHIVRLSILDRVVVSYTLLSITTSLQAGKMRK